MTDIKSLLLRTAIRSGYYPSLWFSRAMWLLGRWHWWDQVEGGLLFGAVPSPRELRQLATMGVGAVVNLCEEFEGHTRELAAAGLVQLHLPTLDYHCPTEDDLVRGITFIFEHRSATTSVYVHCKAGRGRSAAMVLCYLMAAHGIDAREAYARVKAARSHVTPGLYGRPGVRAIESRVCAGEWSDAAAAPATGSKKPTIKLR